MSTALRSLQLRAGRARRVGLRAVGATAATVLGVGIILSVWGHPAVQRHLPAGPQVAEAATTRTLPAATAQPAAVSPVPVRAAGHRAFADSIDVAVFQKGNIHTHTKLSDGDRPPETVYNWYRNHGYNFLAITDHNQLTAPEQYRHLERKRFVMITGEEVTMRGAGKAVHVNGLCIKHAISGPSFDTQGQALAWAVREITAQGGVALVNHPNWEWALTAADLPDARGARLLEIASGHPFVHTLGDATHLSHEAMWDVALSAGQDFAGVAVDDAHTFALTTPEPAARPGRGWVQVFATEPSRPAICQALALGRLYSSTGVTLKRIVVNDDAYAVYPADPAVDIEFIGEGGRVLQRGKAGRDGAARYQLTGDETYVRVRATSAEGKHAWTQPSRVVR